MKKKIYCAIIPSVDAKLMPEVPQKSQPINFLENTPVEDLSSAVKKPRQEKRRKDKIFLCFIIAFTLALSISIYVKNYTTADLHQNESTAGMKLLEPKKPGFFKSIKNFLFASDNLLIGQKEDRINILLLGVGGFGHDGPYLSDTNIIVSIKPGTEEVAMISIPRDLGVQIEKHGIYKINYADAFGESKYPGQGGEYARQIFNQTFGLEIPYYIRADFTAFKRLIDDVGGIEIYVKRPFIDQSFPGPDYSYQTVSFKAGSQFMNGERALQYARSRHGSNGENSDFARAKRQQQILAALKDKILSFGTLTNPVTVQKIWESLSGNVVTNLDFGQLMYLVDFFKKFDNSKIKNFVLDDGPEGYLTAYIAPNSMYILAPKSGVFDEINLAIAKIFDPNFKPRPPATTRQTSIYGQFAKVGSTTSMPTAETKIIPFDSVTVEIKNGTWRAGLAARIQNLLVDNGFSVVAIGNSLKKPLPTTKIYLINRTINNEALSLLIKKIPGKITTELPDWLSNEYDDPTTMENEIGPKFNQEVDVLVVLGADTKE